MAPGRVEVLALAAAVRSGERGAREVVAETLAGIAARNGAINAFTAVTESRAYVEAARVDAARAAGRDPGPLAGVPFAVKNLYDIEGLATVDARLHRGNIVGNTPKFHHVVRQSPNGKRSSRVPVARLSDRTGIQ